MPFNIPLLDLTSQIASLRGELQAAFDRVLEHQCFINGPEVLELEKQIAAYCSCNHAIGVSSGTDALLCSLMALGIGPGDEVITSPFTFFATLGSIVRLGAKPVLVDIDPDTFNLDPIKISKALTRHTKAILPVHLFGQCAEMDPIIRVAQDRDLLVIEDAAQSIGATYRGHVAGSIGTLGCFSFFPSKNLGALGDAGMITTQDGDLAEHIRILRQHGSSPKYYHKKIGGNFRLDTLQAAFLLTKLKYLDEWTRQRQNNAQIYAERLANNPSVTLPHVNPHNVSVFNQYVIRVRGSRDQLMKFLKENNIGCEIYYPLCMHEQECFKYLGYQREDFPLSSQAASEVLALPIYPGLERVHIEYIASTIDKFFDDTPRGN